VRVLSGVCGDVPAGLRNDTDQVMGVLTNILGGGGVTGAAPDAAEDPAATDAAARP
jgi:hypothetical protein